MTTQEPLQTVEGTLEHVIYSNEENHYTVAQLLPEGGTRRTEPIIIVGMGVTIAGLMMSIYLPMFEMAGKVH